MINIRKPGPFHAKDRILGIQGRCSCANVRHSPLSRDASSLCSERVMRAIKKAEKLLRIVSLSSRRHGRRLIGPGKNERKVPASLPSAQRMIAPKNCFS